MQNANANRSGNQSTSASVEEFYARMTRIHGARPSSGSAAARNKSAARLTEQREERVRDRLAVRGQCNLSTLSCAVHSCRRSFESVRVLAWHLSYSHTDEKSHRHEHLTCYVCAMTFKSVKVGAEQPPVLSVCEQH